MRNLHYLALAVMVLACSVGCDKEEEEVFSAVNLPGTWTVVKYNDGPYNIPHVQTYHLDGSFDEMMTIVGVPKTYTGTWKLNVGDRVLRVSKENENQSLDVLVLTSLRLKYTDRFGDTFELEKQ